MNVTIDTILWEMGGECASQMESGLKEHLYADVHYSCACMSTFLEPVQCVV